MNELLRICWTVSPSLLEAIDKARGERERNAWIEDQLWRLPVIQRTGVLREDRRGPGALKETEAT